MSSSQGNAAVHHQVMDLTADSQAQKAAHDAMMQQLEVQKVAGSTGISATGGGIIAVPTLPADVRAALRQLGLPVRLFGENLADVRQRLRLELATRHVGGVESVDVKQAAVKEQEEQEQEELVTKYTRADPELLQARQEISAFSLQRAAARLARERKQRVSAKAEKQQQRRNKKLKTTATTTAATTAATAEDESENKDDSNSGEWDLSVTLDEACVQTYQQCRRLRLQGSQFGDSRSLSAICAGSGGSSIVATSSWTGSIHLWDGRTAALSPLGSKTQCHEDRIMWMDCMSNNNISDSSTTMLTTASIDMTAKLWKVSDNGDVVMKDGEDDKEDDNNNNKDKYSITEMAHLKGHAARLCRTAFHPMQKHVATTSFDHTWRLWDVETSQNILLQDGHAAEVFGLAFHPDGSLVSTTDFASVVQLWDLRTGKSIQHYAGQHARRVLSADFSPNGIHLATAGDDGTIKIWDLRKRPSAAALARGKQNALIASIPAHSRLITRVKFDQSSNSGSGGAGAGEYLVSSSFDGLAKIWSARDWKLLKELQGHDGQVSSVDILPSSSSNNSSSSSMGIVTCGFDKTLKLWK